MAYDKLVLRQPRFGINPDGPSTESIAVTRVVRHTWQEDATKAILRGCKAHGVTVTQVCSAALIMTAIRFGPKAAPEAEGDENLFFKIHLPIDLLSRAPKAADGPREAAVRVGHYPTFLSVPRAAVDEGEDALYALARQVKERHVDFVDSPWFWHFIRHYLADSQATLDAALDAAAKPEAANAPVAAFLPLLSSLGDWSKKLPAVYAVKAKDEALGETVGELRVADVSLHLKVIPDTPCLHLWTYGGKMNFQLTHNIMHTSAALMDPFFESFIKTVSDIGRA
ncbi:uncharacterized protein B0H18DRAFT_1011096 [Fomitopsis serialis]|uniref:uncharacterized protein n=1 Tax=Fomitopsis serialis TaxID=139415 RepID=UPI0020083BE8|nr:uncharacterized protein B0H18DRAFT_1011096 [Neoantrodia serialis]KAH9924762.1 hypothetical protein B0H18DRAFT_1011096 [Neoantrodia serialis]